jgi:O-antigen ligase
MELAFLGVLGAVAIAAISFPLLQASVRTPVVGFWLVTAPSVLREAFSLPRASLAGFELGVGEFAGLLLLLAAGLRLTAQPRRFPVVVVTLMGGLFAVALLRGLVRGETTTLEYSNHLMLLAGVSYGMTFPLNAKAREGLFRALQSAAIALVAVFVLVRLGALPGSGTWGTLAAGNALIIALALVGRVLRWLRSSGGLTAREFVVIVGLGLAVVILQHRTVWAVLGVAAGYLFATARRKTGNLLAGGFLLLAAVLLLDLLGVQGSRTPFEAQGLTASLQQATADERTFEWRTQRWEATLESNAARGTVAVWFGSGYGTPWVESGVHATRTEPPHSQYVELAVRFGIVGLLLWSSLVIVALARLWRTRAWGKDADLSNEFLGIIITSLAVWSVTYSIVGAQPALLGFALAAALPQSGKTRDESGGFVQPITRSSFGATKAT